MFKFLLLLLFAEISLTSNFGQMVQREVVVYLLLLFSSVLPPKKIIIVLGRIKGRILQFNSLVERYVPYLKMSFRVLGDSIFFPM